MNDRDVYLSWPQIAEELMALSEEADTLVGADRPAHRRRHRGGHGQGDL